MFPAKMLIFLLVSFIASGQIACIILHFITPIYVLAYLPSIALVSIQTQIKLKDQSNF